MRAISRIRETLSERPETVLWLVGLYYVAAVTLRVLRIDGLQNDEAEQLVQSQYLLFGYGRQPPLYNWLQYGLVQILGPSILALSLLKNGLLFLTCLFYGLAARSVLKDKALAASAMLGVLTIPAISVLAQRDLSHAVATMCSIAFFLYAFMRTLKAPSLCGYALTGAAIGIGAITKYNFVVLPLAAWLAVFAEPTLRKHLFDRRIALTVLIALIICLPHAVWIAENFKTATSGTIAVMREDSTHNGILDRFHGLLMIVTSTVDGGSPLFAFFFFAFRGDLKSSWRACQPLARVLFLTFVFSLVIIAIIAVSLRATTVTQKWLSPFLLLLPLYLCLKLESAGKSGLPGMLRLSVPVFILAFGFILYLTAANLIGPSLGSRPKDNVPSIPFVRQVLDARGDRPMPAFILADGRSLAGSARIAARTTPVFTPSFPQAPAPDADLWKQGGLIIWQDGNPDDVPVPLIESLARAGIAAGTLKPETATLPYIHSSDRHSASFGYAWLTPQ
ncbi:MAG: glycosyltransferase family 39 protein [Neorhizobium sp.]|nr:glycosyltransferase family 39 protein [Neorhizobium sp.]